LSSPAARARFRQLVQAREERLERLFRRSGVDSIDIDTEQDYTMPLSMFFRARARRM
jgi:hypothetical protein